MIKINIDSSGFKEFAERLKTAADGEFKKAVANEVEKGGLELLDGLSKELIARQVTDTRNLASSFGYGSPKNVFDKQGDGLSVEVGTTVDYASYVNDGHMTRPGPNRRWVEGKHFKEAAERSFEKDYVPKMLENLDKWLQDHIGK